MSNSRMRKSEVTYKPLIRAGMVLGVGLGGFVDGILFHQLLQVHNMLSARLPKTTIANIEVNMFWDGLFHSFTLLMTLMGIAMLWRAGKREEVPWAGKAFAGSCLMGWGIFNFSEGIVDHYVLNIHHVVESMGPSVYDLLFVASGVVFIIGGWLAIRKECTQELAFHPTAA
jgi:uncharacterized membrane protein